MNDAMSVNKRISIEISLSSLAISKFFDIFKPRPIELSLSRTIKNVHNRISTEDMNFKRNKLSNEYHALKRTTYFPCNDKIY